MFFLDVSVPSTADFSRFATFLKNFLLTNRPYEQGLGHRKSETPSFCAGIKSFGSGYNLDNDQFFD